MFLLLTILLLSSTEGLVTSSCAPFQGIFELTFGPPKLSGYLNFTDKPGNFEMYLTHDGHSHALSGVSYETANGFAGGELCKVLIYHKALPAYISNTARLAVFYNDFVYLPILVGKFQTAIFKRKPLNVEISSSSLDNRYTPWVPTDPAKYSMELAEEN
ncbi:hypothetical protein FOL47_008050 [Perkinsus chesapeaki]|uniref:Uncharacterized protein n=1 Tax=Perkinsus chesapeaki TaxID=330153 RepID=A0A7J6N2I1_PERCH|nr:hypothetical protein FOL47_008050 [Perkinsus chesapeaki]